jgi:hypothetical protein
MNDGTDLPRPVQISFIALLKSPFKSSDDDGVAAGTKRSRRSREGGQGHKQGSA